MIVQDFVILKLSIIFIDNIQSATVTKTFSNAYKWFAVHGITIKETMIDNGSEFTAYTS